MTTPARRCRQGWALSTDDRAGPRARFSGKRSSVKCTPEMLQRNVESLRARATVPTRNGRSTSRYESSASTIDTPTGPRTARRRRCPELGEMNTRTGQCQRYSEYERSPTATSHGALQHLRDACRRQHHDDRDDRAAHQREHEEAAAVQRRSVLPSTTRIVTRMRERARPTPTAPRPRAPRRSSADARRIASHGSPAPASTPSATPTSRPIACESLPRYARDGSPVGDTSTAIHTVDATAPSQRDHRGAHRVAHDRRAGPRSTRAGAPGRTAPRPRASTCAGTATAGRRS